MRPLFHPDMYSDIESGICWINILHRTELLVKRITVGQVSPYQTGKCCRGNIQINECPQLLFFNTVTTP